MTQSCLVSSFFRQPFNDSYLWSATTDLDQTWSKVPGSPPIHVTWPQPGQRSRRGHGVKNTIFTKNFSTRRRFEVRSSNFRTWIVSRPSTNDTYREFCRRSRGVAEVKFKGQIFKFVRFQQLTRQIVRLEPTIKTFHGDLFVRPFLKGSKVKERSNFQLCPISKVKVSYCSSWTNNQKFPWWPRCTTFP